ncbi:MAG TPA: hypothetical protein P5330_10520, partial [Candidatus Competibacteraceae bacterium]|nr:hypothetical protein [Candidatus Competibacteraceae bacterium]
VFLELERRLQKVLEGLASLDEVLAAQQKAPQRTPFVEVTPKLVELAALLKDRDTAANDTAALLTPQFSGTPHQKAWRSIIAAIDRYDYKTAFHELADLRADIKPDAE